jgi:outer membrane lipopolysaccharide assembly protein LptE/RlpB
MAKLHVVSVGGTGHKVLASMIHLAACGAFRSRNTNQVNEINIISIDADNGNGNLARTTRTFLGYKKLYQALHRDDSNLINIDSVVPSINISLFQDDKKSLTKTFNFAQYNATPEEELIRFLYTDSE